MTNPSPCLGSPDTQSDGNRASQENSPADPSRLTGKLDERKERKECKDSSSINKWRRDVSSVGMLPEGGLPRIIQSWLDRSIHESIIGGSSRLHDRRHCADTEDHSQQS